ncbi:MAG: helix-turn-helix transcriptional regulator [Lentisphaerae bacterium]|nr:helix-turn-helix transcriptional regulator [Lentisphaerota bacterium]
MDYFQDISFVVFGANRKNTTVARNRVFDGYYGLQFVRSGEILVRCEDEDEWQASGPVVFFTSPDKHFTYYSPRGSRDHLFVCFRGERVERYLQSGLLPDVSGKKFPITDPETFSATMDSLLRMLRRRSATSFGEAVLLLEKAMLLTANQPPPRKAEVFNRDFIRDLAERISEHPEEQWDFQHEASVFNISEVHLRRLFIMETGMSPRHYVLHHRISYASALLQSTDMLIKEIAYECGFGGEFYFSRQFAKVMKQSPSEFRKKILYLKR